MLFQTTAEHEALRKEIRRFAEAEIKPIAFSEFAVPFSFLLSYAKYFDTVLIIASFCGMPSGSTMVYRGDCP